MPAFQRISMVAVVMACALTGREARAAQPERLWATYLGYDTPDEAHAVAVDGAGNLYVGGAVSSKGFATPGAHKMQPEFRDAFLVKFDPAGDRVWGTYFGGSNNESIHTLVVKDDTVMVAGLTASTSQIAFGQTFQTQHANGVGFDGFVARFTTDGALVWATYVGGLKDDDIDQIALGDAGEVYLTGQMSAGSMIVGGVDPHQPVHGGGNYDCFLMCLDDAGKKVWGTYYGGEAHGDTCHALARRADGALFIAGETGSTTNIASDGAFQAQFGGMTDMFVAAFDGDGKRTWGTYLGGPLRDNAAGLAIHPEGGVVVVGDVGSPELSTDATALGGSTDGLIARFDDAGARVWSTYYGGAVDDGAEDVSLGPGGAIYVAGYAASDGLASAEAFQPMIAGQRDAFILKLSSAGAHQWSTYFGGEKREEFISLALTDERLILAGTTISATGIGTPGSFQEQYGGSPDQNEVTDWFFASLRETGQAGAACDEPAACVSGFCVDGVCCDTACGDGDASDCQACGKIAGAAVDGACGPREPGECRPAKDACDVAELCDGMALTCPADQVADDGAPCTDGMCMAGMCIPSETTTSDDSTTSDSSGDTGVPTSGGETSSSASSTAPTTGGNDTGPGPTSTTSGGASETDGSETGGAATGGSPMSGEGGCGCTSTAPSSGLLVAWVIAMLPRRRRRS